MPFQLQKSTLSFHEFNAPRGSSSIAALKDSNASESVLLFEHFTGVLAESKSHKIAQRIMMP